ncbi:Ig-like domain-containing protein [Rhodoferax sp.]|uniref:Ig-like domain-containing protein n=1 Tax=Rhodoferax sp. TaxID=50421 RepID=UPI00284C2807|nr:Ig-like domain-containing protein [Rhodoferax sp.]MDR3370020.1 Ig-like domain-containing protein [Rhodoferax sp.]
MAVSGPGSTLVGPSALTYSVKAVDSGGKPVVGAALIVSSSNGNTIAPANLSTDVNGSANFSFTPKVAGNDTLTVSGLGTSATTTVAVSNQDFAFVQPASAASLMVNTSNIVQVCYKVSGVVTAPTSAVAFSTTRGTLGVTTYPDTQGCTSTTVTSTTAGPVTISAQMGTARSSITAAFIATVPATIVLQANPSAVLPNAGSSTTNQSTLSATVRDATGNPVSGQVVNFTTTQDVSNGSIVPGSGTTDSNGMTSVQFIPGALSTPANGVVVKATVESNPTLFKTTTLTVNGNALFISIGIANTLAALDAATYQKQFSVYVTDANGAPATGRAVTISAYAPTYRKGFLTWFANATPATWGYSVVASGLASPIICPNEDVTRSGIIGGLNVDINGNGKLDPGLPVVISPATVTTDGNGFATFYLSYGKNYAWWLDTQITARATVSGTESSQIASYSLEMLTADATSQNTPPNQKSPFGTTWTGSAYDGLCNNPN